MTSTPSSQAPGPDAAEDLAPLFQPAQMGALALPHRVLMAPLTRNRAEPDGRPGPHAAEYYRQRASAGAIFTEATQISAMGKGYLNTPGLHSDAHVEGWRRITDAVRAEGGRTIVQLWHVGRISHVSLLPVGAQPVAPSAIRAQAQTFTAAGFEDVSEPRALEAAEIAQLVEDYRSAARRAKDAGFDAAELHSANGYLLDQFVNRHTNHRTDGYGGSPQARARLTREATEAVAEVMGADRVGVRLSPTNQFNDMARPGTEEDYAAVITALDELGLAFLHMVEQFPGAPRTDDDAAAMDALRALWSGFYIANGEFDAATAARWIGEGRADAIAFGRAFIANPDLPERMRVGAALNAPDPDTFYGGDHRGYTDYPFMRASA